MSSDAVAIRLEHVSKRYRAGRSRTFVDLVASGLDRLRGRSEDVYSAAAGQRSGAIHALNDVSFDVSEGSGLGIIGSNGAGKTTLLKLISRVTWPTSGRVRVAGRVVSLIELGAGFHPELTGRENVYLGAGLFGLPKREVDKRFDDIVRFAEVERVIDTPMKRYSSGLYARLGFSVAVHSNPDIVLVDEVLAVGDAAFRRRAVESLRGLITAGKTVLFISHDIWSVRRLCDRILWMDDGRIRASGAAPDIAEQYKNEVNLRALANQQSALLSHRTGTGEIRCTSLSLGGGRGDGEAVLEANERRLAVQVHYEMARPVAAAVFQISIVDVDTGVVVTTATSAPLDGLAAEPTGVVECVFEPLPLRRRQYVLQLTITDRQHAVAYDVVSAGPRFTIGAGPEPAETADYDDGTPGILAVPYRFEHHLRVMS